MHRTLPAILFGAFDRHNFGDMLFPHVIAALLGDKHLRFAGLAERDLSVNGGHHVMRLQQHVESLRESPYKIVHVGGEVLSCSAWEAAVMLLPAAEAMEVAIRLDGDHDAQLSWARACLGTDALVPYAVSRAQYPDAAEVIYHAVGGADLVARHPAQRDEVMAKLSLADVVSVRDATTQAHLHNAGIVARLLPDPAVMVAELLGTQILAYARDGEAAKLQALFPAGYVAVQFSSEFDDDASLDTMATQLKRLGAKTGYGVVFFRAGAAPWHDDLQAYRRIMAQMTVPQTYIVTTLQLWDICAVIASSKLYIGSSLHGRILAMAYALPRLNIRHATHSPYGKQWSYAHTWEMAGMPGVVTLDGIHTAALQALAVEPYRMRQTAADLASAYRRGFALDFASRR
ncbi:polysaccharide pyruvyl transferase family protein [Herbaspirillum sp. GCM10030257]|uniref:polysaccharide pyruvyl transferase family protein n=1 Tax=Herbaspirillum sp. GCM10030257 TaxID=3273393 RepID=UPI0036167AA3